MSEMNEKLPHWDMTIPFPSLESAEFAAAFDEFGQAVEALTTLFDEAGIDKLTSPGGAPVQVFEAAFGGFNQLIESAGTLRAYIVGYTAVDSRNDFAQARMSEYQRLAQRHALLGTRLTAWIGDLDVEALILASGMAADHAFLLRRSAEQAKHLMSPAEENLASELNLSAGSAWTKLQGNFASQLTVKVEIDGIEESMPMSAARNLAYHPDRAVRKAAYEAELEVWARASVPIAAALNGVKGEVSTLAQRRGWPSVLDASLFDNGIDQAVLDAMLGAARDAFPDFRRYFRAKAKVLGLEQLAWYDLFAPITGEGRAWTYTESARFIVEQFNGFSERMGAFAQRAFADNWIDAEPRTGKRDGAFCMRLQGDESRILTNFKPTYPGLNTLAHELGHGYHGHTLAGRTPIQRAYPMTLAETASIFCETIVRRAALQSVDAQEQFNILESSLMGAAQVVVDINSRFLFEQAAFDQRAKRELSVNEFNALMLDAQAQTYGDAIDPDQRHPYMWAVKPHYYYSNRSFYNFPYMFGLLFGLGLYARYQEDADAFRANYDDLLSSTGLASAPDLAARFGFDLRDPAFWTASFDVLRADIGRFEALVQG